MIVDLTKRRLLRQLHLVDERVPSGGRPISCQAVVASYPLGTDISVQLYVVRLAVSRGN